MGGGGRSSSSSTQKSTNQSFDERIAVTDDGVVVRDAWGTSIDKSTTHITDARTFTSITEIDNGAVDRAFDFAEAISSDAATAVDRSFDFALNVKTGAFELVEEMGQAVNATANRAFDFVESQNEEVGQDVIKAVVPWIVGAIVVVAVMSNMGASR